MKDIRIAAVTVQAQVGRIRENLGKMEKWVMQAKQKKTGIICFPEMNVTGYSIKKDIHLHAQSVPGEVSDEVARMADRFDMVILFGMVLKDSRGNLYAAHLVASPGKAVRIYLKLHLGPPEKEIYTAGDDIPVFDDRGIRFGIQLCYDAHFPELSTHMAANGVDVIFIPHASPRGASKEKFNSWMRHLPARAYDNSVFIVCCNQIGNNDEGLIFPGVSVVIGPTGEVIGKNLRQEEGILIADLYRKDFDAVRNHRMRYFFHNRRPELYLDNKIK